MSTPDPGARLLGRRSECAALDELVASVRAGPSRALVLRGEAGVGKSALLEYLVRRASGCRVARAAGVESEMELAFAGLHQLCAPFVDRLERLPGPQRDALGTAFGLRDGDAPDRFLVGLAVLSLLSDVAEERPLVCVVDDAQWLDAASAQALAFVARRLGAESVGLVFAVREPAGERHLEGLPELVVGGLDDGDARALLEAVVAGPLDERVRDRIVAETHGNPLALLELPRGRTPAELAGGFGLDGGPALSGRIEESFRERLAPLPPATRLLLLVAAAEPVGDPLLVWKAAAALGIDGRRGGTGGRGGPGRARRAGALPAPARALGGLPGGRAGGPPARPPRARRGHRRRRRSRPPRLAPRPGDGRARRGRRRRAGALGRAGAGARRPGRGRRVPRARRRADARPGAPGAARAGRRAGQAPGRRAGRGAAAAGDGARRDRWTSSSARARSCCTRRSRSPRRAAATLRRCCSRPPSGSSRSTRRSRARRTSTRSPPRSPPTGWCAAAMRARSPRRSSPPTGSRPPPAPATCCSTGSPSSPPRATPRGRRR